MVEGWKTCSSVGAGFEVPKGTGVRLIAQKEKRVEVELGRIPALYCQIKKGSQQGIGGGTVREGGEKAVPRRPHMHRALNREPPVRDPREPSARASSPPHPLQLRSGVRRLFSLLCKTPRHFLKSKWHNNPLCPKSHKYKKMQSPYTPGKSRAMELRVLQASVQTPNSQNRPSKNINNSNKRNQS